MSNYLQFKTFETFVPRKVDARMETDLGKKIEQEHQASTQKYNQKLAALKPRTIVETTAEINGQALNYSTLDLDFPIGTELYITKIKINTDDDGIYATLADDDAARELDLDPEEEYAFYVEDIVNHTKIVS